MTPKMSRGHSDYGMPIVGGEKRLSERPRSKAEAQHDADEHTAEFPTHKTGVQSRA